ncbi:hypothetical protein BK816_00245 [Boudabousia tangfeifanii]|uniref:Multidrug ABC transporter ATP-binding protein n=1 Tax=Boudabousia tangfeifanii TaxID=1912795 RepID=A0A1D9MHY3_9ACTO|nr:ABC transporter ATP-binding protein [Boudabousia tangfeifanii]AOZ71912.1 hypothetical protein BK816_00245 [Boudabousia tangfeifanii]
MKLPVADGPEIRHQLKIIAKDNRQLLWAAMAGQVVATIAATVLPLLTGKTLDAISAGASRRWITWAIVGMFALLLVRVAFTYFSEWCAGIMGERVFQHLRDKMIYEVTHLPLSVVETAGTGDLVGRVTNDVRRVQSFITGGAITLLQIFLTLIITYTTAMVTSPRIGWVLILSAFPVYYLLKWFLSRANHIYQANGNWENTEPTGQVTENAEQAETLTALNLQNLRQQEFANAATTVWSGVNGAQLTRSVTMAALNVLVLSPLFFLLLMAIWGVPKGTITIGEVTTIAMYVLQVRAPMTSAIYWTNNAQIAWSAFSRIFGVGLLPPDRTPTDEQPANRQLQIENVSFEYQPGRPVLRDVSLDLVPGERLAIVGTSGAGKSTLARLIAGIDGPTSGAIKVGGVEMLDMNEQTLHSQVALITQEHHIFTGTLADNLWLARPDATEDELWDALKTVEANWVQDLPQGLHTEVGASKESLGPSQAQQIALARLILLDPHTVILDEATSMMDPSSAHQLERTLNKALAGRTVIMIAHRLFTAQDADRVAVMHQGQIAEIGTHEELIAAGRYYAKLWNAWQSQ